MAEGREIVAPLESGAITIGIGPAQPRYPHDIAASRLSSPAAFAIHVAPTHPLAARHDVTDGDLPGWRSLYLRRHTDDGAIAEAGWSAPDYLTLPEMAAQGLGWGGAADHAGQAVLSMGRLRRSRCGRRWRSWRWTSSGG